MSMRNIDLNLLVFLDVLLKERNVTRAAESLGISQPAMSNGLRRLRDLFGDPLLVRTSDGMKPTERAELLQPLVFLQQVFRHKLLMSLQLKPLAEQNVSFVLSLKYKNASI